jgi:hypothetical protein
VGPAGDLRKWLDPDADLGHHAPEDGESLVVGPLGRCRVVESPVDDE